MASAWTKSGINWDDLSRASIRDVVRELYIAVSERDFWVRHFGSGGFATLDELQPIDYDATQRHRTKSQIEFILNAVSNWLSLTSAYYQPTGDTDIYKNGYRGSFIDFNSGSDYNYVNYGMSQDYQGEYFAGNLYNNQNVIESLQLGYSSFDKSEGGSLESELNIDLSFLRAYDENVSFRFTYKMMESIFKILNYLTYTRRCSFRSVTNGVSKVSDFNTFRTHQGDWRQDGSFEERRDAFYNDGEGSSINTSTSNHYYQIQGFKVSTNQDFWEMGSVGFGSNSYSENFKYTTFEDEIYLTDDFDHLSLIYNLTFKIIDGGVDESDLFLLTRPKGHTIRENPFVNLTVSNDGLELNPVPAGVWVENDFGIVKDGDIPDSIKDIPPDEFDAIRGQFVEQNIPLINFNKVGFLKYYTEETN